MDLSSLNPVAMIVLMIGAATPILLAALGELVVEKSGVLNLGVEGMMIIGAVTGFIAATESGSPYVGMLAAMIGGAMVAAIFAFLTQFLLSNQVATGLALTLFGLGLAALLGGDYNGIKPPATPRLNIEGLSDLPIVGELLFSYDPVIYFSIFLVFCVWYFLNRTRGGLILRACGENHDAAHSLGYNSCWKRVRSAAAWLANTWIPIHLQTGGWKSAGKVSHCPTLLSTRISASPMLLLRRTSI